MSPRTREALERHGITVVPLHYDAMWLGGGGIHCPTAPLIRDPV